MSETMQVLVQKAKLERWRNKVLENLANYESRIGRKCPNQRGRIERMYENGIARLMEQVLIK